MWKVHFGAIREVEETMKGQVLQLGTLHGEVPGGEVGTGGREERVSRERRLAPLLKATRGGD